MASRLKFMHDCVSITCRHKQAHTGYLPAYYIMEDGPPSLKIHVHTPCQPLGVHTEPTFVHLCQLGNSSTGFGSSRKDRH